jgi:hypothetical protein
MQQYYHYVVNKTDEGDGSWIHLHAHNQSFGVHSGSAGVLYNGVVNCSRLRDQESHEDVNCTVAYEASNHRDCLKPNVLFGLQRRPEIA